IASIIREFRLHPPTPLERTYALVCCEEDLLTTESAWRFATRYMEAIGQGIHPAIILEHRAQDAEYVKSRGITEIIS
ncbi:MAG TPA: hypothetical protein VF719_06535, partial [Abditibacteriaceae bacterium]